jgi:hypothetical protein
LDKDTSNNPKYQVIFDQTSTITQQTSDDELVKEKF